jgi:WD40 repeat protein
MGQCRAHLSGDGKTVALDEHSGDVHRLSVWDVPSGKMIFRLTPGRGSRIGAYALSPDGKQLALERTDGPAGKQTLRVHDLASGRAKDLGTLEFNVYDIRFSADGKRIVTSETSSGTGASTFACFDVPGGKQLWRLPRNGQTFAVSPDGRTLVSAVFKGKQGFQVVETDPGSGKPTERFQPYLRAHPNVPLVIAPDNRTVVIGDQEEIILWDLKTGKEVGRFAHRQRGGGYGPRMGAISADSRSLVTNLGYLQRWDLTTGKPFFPVPPDDGVGGPVEFLAFTSDGQELFATSWSGEAARWNVTTGKRVGYWPHVQSGRQRVVIPAGFRTLEFGDDPKWNEIILSEPTSGKHLQTVRWAEPNEVGINGVRAYTLTADGKTLLVAHGDEPGGGALRSYVTACDVASGRRLARFAVPGNFYYLRPPFSSCGRWVVLGGKVYHVGTGTELFTPLGEPNERLLPEDRWAHGPVWFSKDSRLLAGRLLRKTESGPVNTDTLAVWELASGKMLARFSNSGQVRQVAFASDGRTFAQVDAQGVFLWDLLTGTQRARFQAPDVPCDATVTRGGGAQTLVFAPDGRKLATGHQNGTVQLWLVPPLPGREPRPTSQTERDNLWADLGSDSPGKARAAVERLTQHPEVATALLKVRFRPPSPTPDDDRIRAHLQDLDSDVFATREEAVRKLREYGARAEPALRRELASGASLEMRLRIQRILDSITPPLQRLRLSGEALRGVRAIEVLERVGTAEPRALLRAWSEQGSDVRLATEARLALERPPGSAAKPAPDPDR